MKFIPRQHQTLCLDVLRDRYHAGLLLDMGLG